MKNLLLSHRPGIRFWIIIICISLFPFFLGQLGIPLYLTPQIEYAITFFATIYLDVSLLCWFLLGLFIDVAYLQPIGLSSLLLIIMAKMLLFIRVRLLSLNMRSVIIYFATILTLMQIIRHIIFAIYYSSVPYYREILANILVNIIFYMILHSILHNKIYSKYHENF